MDDAWKLSKDKNAGVAPPSMCIDSVGDVDDEDDDEDPSESSAHEACASNKTTCKLTTANGEGGNWS